MYGSSEDFLSKGQKTVGGEVLIGLIISDVASSNTVTKKSEHSRTKKTNKQSHRQTTCTDPDSDAQPCFSNQEKCGYIFFYDCRNLYFPLYSVYFLLNVIRNRNYNYRVGKKI